MPRRIGALERDAYVEYEKRRQDRGRHDILLAEGLPTESYLDIGNRAEFSGGATLTLHPLFAASAHEMACRPFALVGPAVEAARAMLARRTAIAPPSLLRRVLGRSR